MPLPASLDPDRIRRHPKVRHYFRYPLGRDDFHPLRRGRRLLGYMAAKPLYGRLTAHGRVDRSGGFSGRIAVIYIPSPAHSLRGIQLLFARLPRQCITRPDGRRNWPFIHRAAVRAIEQFRRRAAVNRNESSAN